MPVLSRHLGILGVSHNIVQADLKIAYYREIRVWHPDLHHGNPSKLEEATSRSKEINAAYEYLSELLELGPIPKPQQAPRTEPTSSAPNHEYKTRHTYQKQTFTTGFPDPAVFEVFVKSSNLISVGYDRVSRTLYVKFTGNVIYAYYDVPESVFSALMAAESHGSHAHKHIYQKFRSKRF